jgi:hypothetical protein
MTSLRAARRSTLLELVIARSGSDEAIQLPAQANWIASLTLAMTNLISQHQVSECPA